MTIFQIYLLLKLDDVQCLFVCLVGISAIVLVIAFVQSSIDEVLHKKWIIASTACLVLFMLSAALIPSTKQMAIIYVTPKIISAVNSNMELKKLPANIVSLANSWIEELKPKEK